jgi:hypothetical protein
MPSVLYPSTLPCPAAGWTATPRERAARSSVAGDPKARSRWSDRVADINTATWTLSPAQLATWRVFFHTTLVDGQLWFEAEVPGPGTRPRKVMRFRPSSVKYQALGLGITRITAQLEMRGRSAIPTT